MKNFILILGIILMIGGIGWMLFNHFDTWDVLLTTKQKILLNWKAGIIFFIGVFLLKCYKWLEE